MNCNRGISTVAQQIIDEYSTATYTGVRTPIKLEKCYVEIMAGCNESFTVRRMILDELQHFYNTNDYYVRVWFDDDYYQVRIIDNRKHYL